jgi:hypothetical protein
MKKPIIIRLKGTNVEEAKKLIEVRTAVLVLLQILIFKFYIITLPLFKKIKNRRRVFE